MGEALWRDREAVVKAQFTEEAIRLDKLLDGGIEYSADVLLGPAMLRLPPAGKIGRERGEAQVPQECGNRDPRAALRCKRRRSALSLLRPVRLLCGGTAPGVPADESQFDPSSLATESRLLPAAKRRKSWGAWTNCVQRISKSTVRRRRARKRLGEKRAQRFEGPGLSAVQEGERLRLTGPDPMPLYACGEQNTQMICFPQVLLEVPAGRGKLTNTAENICLKRFLIRRLEVLRMSTPN